MKKLKSVSLALLFVLTVSFTMNGSQTLTLSPIVKSPGSILVTKDDTANTVTIKNDLVEIVISKGGKVGGVRLIKWTIKGPPELELAANSKSSYDMGKRYPLWDWIASQTPWPGETCLGAYGTNATDGTYDGKVSISFEHDCTDTPIAGLQIIKILTFYPDKYYFDMQVIWRNPTTGDITLSAPGWANVGYNINAAGYLEPLSDLYQGYQDGATTVMDQNSISTRADAKNLQWVAVYNKATGAIIALKPYNTTGSVNLEQDGSGKSIWGSETRIEYLPVTIASKSEVVYVLKVYGGPPDFAQLTEIDLSSLGAGVAFKVEMDSDQLVYSPNATCNYVINLTNSLADPMTVDVNLTFWKSDPSETLPTGGKISNVKNWPKLTVNGKSTETLSGNLKLTPKFGIHALYLQIYKDNKSIATMILLIPIVSLPTNYKPLTVCFVWNLYQPYLIDSPTLSVWPSTELPGPPSAFLTRSIQDYVEAGSKPYLLHALLLDKYPSINVTFDLQPTLLYQWNVSANERWYYWWSNPRNPLSWEKGLAEPSEACGEALEKYRSLASSGQIEILTSPYYHPIMPVLLAKNWTSDLVDQLELGKNYTQELMEVEPTGLWVPEMAFNMSLVPLINDTGLQYTVLDSRMLQHPKVKKFNADIYTPWYVKDPQTNKTMVAFFRYYSLSNDMASKWSVSSRPSESARQFIASLYTVWNKTKVITTKRVVTIAADEWVSTGGPVADETLDKIYTAIEQCSSWVNTSTLSSALKQVPPKETVTNLFQGSWLNVTSLSGSPTNWFGETNSTVEKLWENVTATREMIMNHSGSLSAETLKTAIKYLYITETSNWFKNPDGAIGPITGRQHVNSYLDAIKQLINPTTPPPPPPIIWYIVAGSLAVVVVASLVYWRRKRIKAAAP